MCPAAARSCAARAACSGQVLSIATRIVPSLSNALSVASCLPLERTWVEDTGTPSWAGGPGVGEAQREDGEQGPASLQHRQEPARCGAAHAVDDEVATGNRCFRTCRV